MGKRAMTRKAIEVLEFAERYLSDERHWRKKDFGFDGPIIGAAGRQAAIRFQARNGCVCVTGGINLGTAMTTGAGESARNTARRAINRTKPLSDRFVYQNNNAPETEHTDIVAWLDRALTDLRRRADQGDRT